MATTSEYEKRNEGNATVFTVRPAPAPKFMFMVIFGAVLSLGGLLAIASGGIFFLAMGVFSLWYGWFRDQRPKDHRNVSNFRVTPEIIEANGRSFRKQDIHRLILRNGITDQELGIQQYNLSTAQATGLAHRARLGQICNSLTVEAGGKSALLAGGMDETTAYGLLRDVSAVLGFDEKRF
jgi:hypothetical protein